MENLKKMSLEDLILLQDEIKDIVKIKTNDIKIWDEVSVISHLNDKIFDINIRIDNFIDSSNVLKILSNMGYSIIVHGKNRFSLIDYLIPKTNGNYFGFNLDKNDGLTKIFDGVSDEEFEKIKFLIFDKDKD